MVHVAQFFSPFQAAQNGSVACACKQKKTSHEFGYQASLMRGNYFEMNDI